MENLYKNKGAVSVFLLILFVVTFVIMGMLVDATRYRMSRTYAESALDLATESVLAHYDQALFEMYGLFGVSLGSEGAEDGTVEEGLKRLYTTYLADVLGELGVEDEAYVTRLAELFTDSRVTEAAEDSPFGFLTPNTLYDFETGLTVGTSVTLATTENVESQIVEYMKFRAPVELLADAKGFLDKVSQLLRVKDRLQAAAKQAEISEKYTNPADKSTSVDHQAQELLKEINQYFNRLSCFKENPVENGISASGERPADRNSDVFSLQTLFRQFDDALTELCEEYENNILPGIWDAYYEAMEKELEKAQEQLWEGDAKLGEEYAESLGSSDVSQLDIGRAVRELSGNEMEELYSAVKLSLRYAGYSDAEQEERLQRARDCLSGIKELQDARDAGYLSERTSFQARCMAAASGSDGLKGKLKMLESNAWEFYNKGADLIERIRALSDRYTSYLRELKEQVDEHPESEDYKTVFLPRMELAEANAGEIVKNLNVLRNTCAALYQIAKGVDAKEGSVHPDELLSVRIVSLAEGVAAKRMIGVFSTTQMKYYQNEYQADASESRIQVRAGTTSLVSSLQRKTTSEEQAAQACRESLQGCLADVGEQVFYFQTTYYRADVDVVDQPTAWEKTTTDQVKNSAEEDGDQRSDSEKEEEEKRKQSVDAKVIKEHPEWLEVAYGGSGTSADDFGEIGLEMDGSAAKALNVGLRLLEMLENLLEEFRDNLYVDAYVMSMFPNYSAEYTGKNKEYNASKAEVEFIIAGKSGTLLNRQSGFGYASLLDVSARLYTIRLLFNTAAMFMDTAKYYQAVSMCSWAGMFTPVAAVTLMLIWAAAESALDVIELEKGKAVPVLKQGADWMISLAGAAKYLANTLIETMAGYATDAMQGWTFRVIGAVETRTNRWIYEVYMGADLDAKAEEWKKELQEVTAELKNDVEQLKRLEGNAAELERLGGVLPDGFAEEVGAISNAADAMYRSAESRIDDALKGWDAAADRIKNMEAVSTLAKEIRASCEETIGALGENGAKQLSASVNRFLNDHSETLIPVGKVVNTGGSGQSVKFDYEDYLWFFLLLTGMNQKVERIQSVLQANLKYHEYQTNGNKADQVSFSLDRVPVAVWADLTYSIRLFFLTNAVVPASLTTNEKGEKLIPDRLYGRVISAQSY